MTHGGTVAILCLKIMYLVPLMLETRRQNSSSLAQVQIQRVTKRGVGRPVKPSRTVGEAPWPIIFPSSRGPIRANPIALKQSPHLCCTEIQTLGA